MNARVPPAVFAPAADRLLATSFIYDDSLTLDLYGRIGEDGYCVKKVTIAGTAHDVTSLFRDKQLDALERWLEARNSPRALPLEWIERCRREVSMYLE